MKVKHKAYGNGIVESFDGNHILVVFGNQVKKFQFPQVFEKFLMTDDSTLLAKIEETKKKSDSKQIASRTNVVRTPMSQKKETKVPTQQYNQPIGRGSSNQLVGDRAQTISIYSEEEMFEIIGYMVTPGRVNSIEAEVPKDGRDEIFERLFSGQKYRPIELGSTPSGMPNKLSPQFRINFGNLRNCPQILKQNMGKGNGSCVGRINKSKFVIQIVQEYGFKFGDYQDVKAIRNIAVKRGYSDAFDHGYSK